MKHTPGPWTQLDQEHAISIVSAGIVIADVFKPDDNCVSPPMSETLDNARLIATAPDLLIALNDAYEELNFDGTYTVEEITRTIDIVRERIARLIATVEKGA